MLKHVDVFLGVALVMLGISLLITIVTQVFSFVTNLRGRELRRGLSELLINLSGSGSKALPEGAARDVAEKLLKHPLISDGLRIVRLAPAVSRSDLLRLICDGEFDVSSELRTKLNGMAGRIDAWFDARHTYATVAIRQGVHVNAVRLGLTRFRGRFRYAASFTDWTSSNSIGLL